MDEASRLGMVTFRNVYGNWMNNSLDKWKSAVSEYSLTPCQQLPNISGKNATDSALIIEAMDILYRGDVDGFIIVSSDSDYTRLAKRLRESGKPVIGMGNNQTHSSFRNSCTKFIILDLQDAIAEDGEKTSSGAKKTEHNENGKQELSDREEIKEAIDRILDDFHDDQNMLIVSTITDKLMNRYPDFSPKNYKYKNMTKLLQDWGYQIKSRNSNNYVVCPVDVAAKDQNPPTKEKLSEEELKAEIEAIVQKYDRYDRVIISTIRDELVKKFPSFKIKDYGCSKMRQLIKKLEFETITDDTNTYVLRK